ncbi:AraC family transcriptional regulator [Nitrobacter sp.]|uniref:AraC family transcriptional regulator n=1 Tax=Nitrobacter sp. TaxID=29420 RepID=UPI0029CAB3A7|nr:helix-turn-helix domain-containing protein [Nitrobacter sp.]
MANIPLTRCQFLLPFADILDGIGAPTGPLLEKFRLPSSLAEKSSLYIPILPAINFAETAQRAQDIEDFGFLAAQHLHFSDLSEKTRVLIAHSPTLLVALQHACKWASLEDTILTLWLEHADDHVKFCSKLAGTNRLPHLEHSQWLQNMFSIYIVRQFTGASWMPATMAFEARYTPRRATQAHWPNTRFLSGQHASWIDVPISHLSLANRSSNIDSPPLDNDGTPSACEIIKSLRLMLPSYLDNRIPPLTDVAELAGVSTRSLQRKLGYAGLTYSDLVETARYERASKLLRDTDSKIIDIAFSSGYADPAHFTRAFRRISGVTPRQFREQSRL